MKYLWTFALNVFALLSPLLSQSILGTWTSDWQNYAFVGCFPDSFIITPLNSTTLSISYYFTDEDLKYYCPSINSNFSNYLTQVSDDIWEDFNKKNMSYNSTTNTIMYSFQDPDQWMGRNVLYNQNDPLISEQDAFGLNSGIWVDPVPVNSSIPSNCCIPYLLFINPYVDYLSINTTRYYDTNCSANLTHHMWSIQYSQAGVLNWVFNSINLQFSPLQTPNNLMLTVGQCQFVYTRSNQGKLIAGTWYADWQSGTFAGIQDYKVVIINNTYMLSNVLVNNVTYQSYLVETPEGMYFDNELGYYGENLVYNSEYNTLLSGDILLSPNGSLLSMNPFLATWNNAQLPDHSPIPDDCCAPDYMNISTAWTQDQIEVTFHYPANYLDNPGCSLISISNSQQWQDYFSVKQYSLTQITWKDYDGSQIYFANSSNMSEITVNFSGQCTFVMLNTPAPLYSLPKSVHIILHLVIISTLVFV